MRNIHCYIIKPINGRYNNKIKIQDKELILNTSIEDHKFVNRFGEVIATPIIDNINNINVGDEVIIHHNIFRRFYNVRGEEKNSRSYFKEDLYFCYYDQIFLYKNKNDWMPTDGFCFVKPIKNKNKYTTDKEKPLTGVLKYLGDDLRSFGLKANDLIGFTPNSEYEFVIGDQRLYRVPINSISIKYEHKKDEVEYNPSWV